MLPASLKSSSGSISAPFQEITSTASRMAQLMSENQLRFGGGRVMVCMLAPLGLVPSPTGRGRKALLHRFIHARHRTERGGQAIEVFQLCLNCGHFAGLLLVLQPFVVLHALHLFKQRQLANRDQLQVA